MESHRDEPLVAVHELSGGTEKAGNVSQGRRDPCPSADNNEASCQSGSIVLPVNPAGRLLGNQDIRTDQSVPFRLFISNREGGRGQQLGCC